MSGVSLVASRACRVLLGLAVGAVIMVLPAAPAAADPLAPTDYRSEVTSVDPAADGLGVMVVGGDGFLQVAVARGHPGGTSREIVSRGAPPAPARLRAPGQAEELDPVSIECLLSEVLASARRLRIPALLAFLR